jgi:hypothetical protein
MTWEYQYDGDSDETAIYWNSEQQAVINGQITRWRNGYPATEKAREAVAQAIQDAGTPERIRMHFDINYGFERREDSDTL